MNNNSPNFINTDIEAQQPFKWESFSSKDPQHSTSFPLTIKGITYQLTREQYQRLANKITEFQQIQNEERLVREEIQRLNQKKQCLRDLLEDLQSSESDDETSDASS